jgi:hypothetical protein
MNRRLEDVVFSVSILSRSKVINNLLKNKLSEKASIFFANLRFLFFCIAVGVTLHNPPQDCHLQNYRPTIWECGYNGNGDGPHPPAVERPKQMTARTNHGLHFITRRAPAQPQEYRR